MEHPSIPGLPGSSNTIDPFAWAALRSSDPLSQAASTPDTLRLSPEDAITLRLQAERDLNATLHAAAERVRYITGASGVALALCETEEDEDECTIERHLTLFDLVMIGAAGTIGSGVFALVGK